MNLSYGIEYNNTLKELINKESLLNHIQISIPGKIALQEAEALENKIPIIVHSNILNVFGENNWDHLKRIAKNISKLKPQFIIEHFTCFRNENSKYGIVPQNILKNKSSLALAKDNISRYRDITKTDISIENIPITRDVELYFELFADTVRSLNLKVTCDFSHLSISSSASSHYDKITQIMSELKPIQIHLSSVRQINGKVFDSHHSLSDDFVRSAKHLFPLTKYFTWEQSSILSIESVRKGLQKIFKLNCENSYSKFLIEPHRIPSIDETNQYLTRHAMPFKISESKKNIKKVKSINLDSEQEIFETYFMFANPYTALDNLRKNIEEAEYLKNLFTLFRLDCIFRSWTSAKNADIKFDYTSNGQNFEILVTSQGFKINKV